MGKILLYYKYTDISCPGSIAKWQRHLCEELGLKGRIIIAKEGINGTVGGVQDATEKYKKAMEDHELFSGIDFKESDGGADCFPRMRVILRDEIVNLGIDPEKITPKQGGTYLTPQQTHELLTNKPNDLIIIDCRNKCESDVGTFIGSIKPNTKHFREFPKYVDEHAQELKDKQILMFCTGGVRCERASGYVKEKTQAKEVFQIKGGIHRYVEQFPNGFFRGKNYVFDSRITIKINDDILGSCSLCSKPNDNYINCANALCNKHVICCTNCIEKYKNTCGATCQQLLVEKKVETRPLQLRVSYESSFEEQDPTKSKNYES
ncbi:rhodanese-related sulfurtransferase [Candidatus Dependentiae bacterium]|nr:rhodanese-related sulfurtransferase [Candidatus Dependentiae bacterium]